MQRKGIRGAWRSPAGLTPTAVPTGTVVDRDMAYSRMDVGGSPLVDAGIIGTSPILGAYTDPADIGRFEQQLNRPIQAVVAFTDPNNPDVWANTFPFDLQWPGNKKLVLSHA